MSYQISCPALFVETTVSADVILTICHHLKNANPEIEDIILDNVIPNRDDLNLTPSEILNDIAIHFYENKSFADLIIRKNLNLLSSVAFLLLGKSSKKECAEITTLLSDWNLDENNIFQALCISFNVLLEIFLSDFPYFSYGEFSFDRDLVIMTQLELTEIFKVNDSISDSNPMLYKNLNSSISLCAFC